MTLLLSDETVRSIVDWRTTVAALREAYAASVDDGRFPARGMARGDRGWLRTLSGAPAEPDLMGLKIIAAAPRDGNVSYLIPLFDQRTAELVALLDGQSITGYRTAATSALAADVLAVAGPLTVAVIGSGFEARNHLRALAAVRELTSVTVYSPREQSRARFVAEMDDLPVSAADSAESAVAAADLIVCAARAKDETPTLHGAWLRPGVTVLSIGSTLPEQREVDTEVLARADLVVADVVPEVLDETGDLIAARDAGIDVTAKTVALADLIGGRFAGRRNDRQIALYKSVGSAVQDLAVANMLVREARRLGAGVTLPSIIKPVQK